MKEKNGNGKNGDAIEVTGLKKSFGPQTVFKGIDLHVDTGESVAVLGPSGTGKSVLLKLLIGLQQPDAGSIRIGGKEIVGLGTDAMNEVRKGIGFLFQQAALYDSLTVDENVAFPLRRHLHLAEDEVRERVHKLLESVGMADHGHKLPSEISGGMQKRVGLARALALDPSILLFDEPTSGLDPITAREIDDLIVETQKQRHVSSLVVTHDVAGAHVFADWGVLLHEGEVAAEGTMKDLDRSSDPYVAEFLKRG